MPATRWENKVETHSPGFTKGTLRQLLEVLASSGPTNDPS